MPVARFLFVTLTISILAFVVRSLVVIPPLWIVILLFLLYMSALFASVLILRLRVFVDAVVAGPRGSKGVVLTFDDGPDPDSTLRVLDSLDQKNAKAIFFVIGKKAEKYPEIVREIVLRGHTIGLHSYAHDRLFAMRGPERWRRDLKKGIRVIEGITGSRPLLFRPPIGHTNPHTAAVLKELRLQVIAWNVSAHDGMRADPDDVAERVLSEARNGSIVLMHDASERGTHVPASIVALPKILEGLTKKDLPIVSLDDWFSSP